MANYLIVGGSSGIGLELAKQLNVAENKVFATYFKNNIELTNGVIEYHYLNVQDENLPFDFLPETLSGIVNCPTTDRILYK